MAPETVEEPQTKDLLDEEKLMLAPEEEEVDPDQDRLDCVEKADYWCDAVRAANFTLLVLIAATVRHTWDSNLSALTISAV